MSLRKYLKASFQTSISSFFTIFISILRVKIVALIVGTSGIGVLGQLNSLSSIIQFFVNLGLNNAIIREVSLKNALGENKRIDKLRATFLMLNISIALPLTIGCFFFSDSLSDWMYDSKEYSNYVKIFSFSILFTTIANVYQTYLAANKMVKEILIKSIVIVILNSISIIYLVYKFKTIGIIYSFPINALINISFLSYFLHRKELPIYIDNVKEFLSIIDFKLIMPILGLGGVFLFSSLLFQFVNLQIKNIIIDYSSISVLGNYQAAFNISKQYVPIFLSSFTVYLLPKFSENIKSYKINLEVNTAIKSLLIYSTLPFLLLIIFSGLVSELLYSSEFKTTGELLRILLVSEYIGIVTKIYLTLAYSDNRKSFIILSNLIVGIGLLLFSFSMVPIYGTKGAASAYLIMSTLNLIISYSYFRIRKKIFIKTNTIIFFVINVSTFIIYLWYPGDQSIFILFLFPLILLSYVLYVGINNLKKMFVSAKNLMNKYLKG